MRFEKQSLTPESLEALDRIGTDAPPKFGVDVIWIMVGFAALLFLVALWLLNKIGAMS